MNAIFIKYNIYYLDNIYYILCCNYGAAGAWGGKGGSALRPPKSDLFYPNLLIKEKNE